MPPVAFDNRGVTLVEMLIAVLMTAIMAAGVGYLLKTVVPTQRAYHARQDDIDALKLSLLFTSKVEQAYEISSPPEPTVDQTDPENKIPTTSSPDLAMKTFSRDESSSTFQQIYFLLRFSNSQLTWCTDDTEPYSCTPTESLLLDWDNGAIKAESGTRFLRGIDVDGDGKLSSRERQFIRAELELGFYEGPAGRQVLVHKRMYYLEKLANVNSARNPD
jgi:prepilin-type N-terminal cleavage/methylation domain-containing protein